MSSTIDPAPPATLRIGTRGSRLALLQTERVVAFLRQQYPDLVVETVVISTQGDRDKQTPLSAIGGQAVFAKDLQQSVLSGEVDCGVHSAKDLTSTMPEGLTLAAILDRADPRDVLISRHPGGLAGLPAGARVGTSSRRRMAQLRLARPDLKPIELRGNIDTRLVKVLDTPDGPYDAAILAAAGVLRMGWEERISEYLDVETFTPAPGQGALGVDCRESDRATRRLLAAVADPDATAEVEAERAFLRTVGGGCTSPLAAHARVEGEILRMWCMYADESMDRIATAEDEADVEDGAALGDRLARMLQDRVEAEQ
ncbi:MAG TPA: hydroxymethylbilane synthase [Thermomicrobiales bacterium]|nr:hydroxymethylbilane synthase [Thermomicrobiales bacterium]